MRIVSFRGPDVRLGTGALLPGDTEVLDLHSPALDLPRGHGNLAWFDLEAPYLAAARACVAQVAKDEARRGDLRDQGAVLACAALRLEAPIPRPGKILCIGRNYREHAAEGGHPVPEQPVLFSKYPSAVTAPGDPVRLPRGSEQVDYEAELGVVIGRRAFRVDEADALDCVAGYVNFNDVTARDFQKSDGQWQRGKSCDTFAPMGPWVLTADEVPDPQALDIQLRLNGEIRQDSNTSMMVFPVAYLISYLSQTLTLEPGDVLATGTPSGVCIGRDPQVFLKAGDVVEVEVAGLGVLRNEIRD